MKRRWHCPYCGWKALARVAAPEIFQCRECGTRCLAGRGGVWLTLTCPSDERKWVVRFLPKLRRIRRDLRPSKADAPLQLAGLWDPELDG
jgi:hypothetical protein